MVATERRNLRVAYVLGGIFSALVLVAGLLGNAQGPIDRRRNAPTQDRMRRGGVSP